MVSAPQHSVSNVLHLVHSGVRPVHNSSQQQAGGVCVSSSRSSGNSSGCSVNSMGRALGVCLSPNCADAMSASQVGALEPVSNTTGRFSSALPAMASNAPQVASGSSMGGASNAMALETASVRSIPQPPRSGSSVHVELIECGLRERQFSEAVAHCLSQTVKASTAAYRPMDSCAMKFLAWKTVFLVALASARRVSCLPALSLEPDPQQPDLPGSLMFGRHKADVTIFTNPAFVAKNQRLDSNPPVVIKSLRSFIAT